jgi:hypothetical protein
MARRRIQEWSGPRRIGRRIDPAAISSSAGIRRHEAPECRQAVHAAGFSRPYAVYENYLVRPKCSRRARPVLDAPEQCCGVCLPSLTSTGSASCSFASITSRSAIARRHCTRPRLRSISGPLCGAAVRKNSRSPRSVLAQFPVPRLPRQATGDWHIACGNCGNSKIPTAAGPRRASRSA